MELAHASRHAPEAAVVSLAALGTAAWALGLDLVWLAVAGLALVVAWEARRA